MASTRRPGSATGASSRHLPVVVSGLLAFFFALSGLSATSAWAAETTTLDLTGQNDGGVIYNIMGVLRSGSTGVADATVDILIDDAVMGRTETNSDGSFLAVISRPPTGAHNIKAVFNGNTAYSASESQTYSIDVGPAPEKPSTGLDVTLDPLEINLADPFSISGTLTSGSAAISEAPITITTSWGSISELLITDEDGYFGQDIILPEQEGAPNTITITVSFQGDNVYGEASQMVSLTVDGVIRTPTPEPTEEEVVVEPTATPTPEVAQSEEIHYSPSFIMVGVIVVLVGVIGLVTFIILAVTGHRRTPLASDEQRGFGSDFGLPPGSAPEPPAGPDDSSQSTAAPTPAPAESNTWIDDRDEWTSESGEDSGRERALVGAGATAAVNQWSKPVREPSTAPSVPLTSLPSEHTASRPSVSHQSHESHATTASTMSSPSLRPSVFTAYAGGTTDIPPRSSSAATGSSATGSAATKRRSSTPWSPKSTSSPSFTPPSPLESLVTPEAQTSHRPVTPVPEADLSSPLIETRPTVNPQDARETLAAPVESHRDRSLLRDVDSLSTPLADEPPAPAPRRAL
ncbi:MAG: Ig-like domain repeat protein [Propionibacteriaceae bacterium]|jgi:hypothetical protein|nr:Ig-like domain repeat protein [Propionibacteriaceae bacterium]